MSSTNQQVAVRGNFSKSHRLCSNMNYVSIVFDINTSVLLLTYCILPYRPTLKARERVCNALHWGHVTSSPCLKSQSGIQFSSQNIFSILIYILIFFFLSAPCIAFKDAHGQHHCTLELPSVIFVCFSCLLSLSDLLLTWTRNGILS